MLHIVQPTDDSVLAGSPNFDKRSVKTARDLSSATIAFRWPDMHRVARVLAIFSHQRIVIPELDFPKRRDRIVTKSLN